jgi:hypothetical protein
VAARVEAVGIDGAHEGDGKLTHTTWHRHLI